jgi:hypothetical protein
MVIVTIPGHMKCAAYSPPDFYMSDIENALVLSVRVGLTMAVFNGQ